MAFADRELQVMLIRKAKAKGLGGHLVWHQTSSTSLFVWCTDAHGEFSFCAQQSVRLHAIMFSIDVQDVSVVARLTVQERNERLDFDGAPRAKLGLRIRGRNRTSNQEIRMLGDTGQAASYGATICADGICAVDQARPHIIAEQFNLAIP